MPSGFILQHGRPALEAVLCRLAEDDAVSAEIVKLRRFAGISVDEAARFRGLSRSVAYWHWAYARAGLVAERRE